jgi:CheY-like chemotaxis protein
MSENIRKDIVIVVAEDDDDEFMLTKEALDACGMEGAIHRMKDGEELMDYLVQRGRDVTVPFRRPAIILMDLNMPRKDGRTALHEIKTHADLSSIPVVVLTNSNSPSDVDKCYQLGANTYICKPCGFKEFLDVLKTVRRYWFESAKLPVK